MKSEDLIKNNALSNITVDGDQKVVSLEIALTAVNMAKIEMKNEAIDIVCPILANCEGVDPEDIVYLEQQMKKLL